jgi:hypothetical protein
MAGHGNIQIPLALFEKTVALLEYMSLCGHAVPSVFGFDAILAGFRGKQRRINLHAAYTRAARATDGVQKELAFSEYAMLKKHNMKQ